MLVEYVFTPQQWYVINAIHLYSESSQSPPLSESSASAHATSSPDDAPPKEKKSKMADDGSKVLVPTSSSKVKVAKPSGGGTLPTPTADGKSSVPPGKTKSGSNFESREAYRSLFNSSAPARPKEQTAHWVTFFPYH